MAMPTAMALEKTQPGAVTKRYIEGPGWVVYVSRDGGAVTSDFHFQMERALTQLAVRLARELSDVRTALRDMAGKGVEEA